MLFLNKVYNFNILRFSIMTSFNFFNHGFLFKRKNINLSLFDNLEIPMFPFYGYDNINIKIKDRLINHKIMGGVFTYFLKQTYNNKIIVLDNKSNVLKKTPNGHIYYSDGIITNIPKINIAVLTINYQAIMIIDIINKVIANICVSWHSSKYFLIKKVVDMMINIFGSKVSNIMVIMGPTLCPCCARLYIRKNSFFSSLYANFIKLNNYNLCKINEKQLYEVGVSHEYIFSSNICIKCNSIFFLSCENSFVSFIRIL